MLSLNVCGPAAGCHSDEYISVITELGEQVANTPVAFTPYYQGFKGMPPAKQKKAEFSDTFFSPGTMAAALRAAGGVVHAVERVLTAGFLDPSRHVTVDCLALVYPAQNSLGARSTV